MMPSEMPDGRWEQEQEAAEAAARTSFPMCCGPPLVIWAQETDSFYADCTICRRSWIWSGTGTERPQWRVDADHSPSDAEREALRKELAAFMEEPTGTPASDPQTPFERFVLSIANLPPDEFEQQQEAVIAAFAEDTFLVSAMKEGDKGPDHLSLPSFPSLAHGLFVPAFTRREFLHRALWKEPEWFGLDAIGEMSGAEIRDQALAMDVAVWINPAEDSPYGIGFDLEKESRLHRSSD